MKCSTCAEPIVSMTKSWIETNAGYFSPPGHDHDDNARWRVGLCVSGHRTPIAIRRSCHVCTWRGREHSGDGLHRVDAWPDIPLVEVSP